MATIRSERRVRSSRVSLKTVGLFAGIGGFELGLGAAGHEPILLCEIDTLARAVLGHQFDIDCHDDIRSLRALPAETDLVVAGFVNKAIRPSASVTT